jgi:hypothetical protein
VGIEPTTLGRLASLHHTATSILASMADQHYGAIQKPSSGVVVCNGKDLFCCIATAISLLSILRKHVVDILMIASVIHIFI